MAFDEIKYRVLVGIFNIAGQAISRQISKPDRDEYKQINKDYYEAAKAIIRENEKTQKPEQITQIQPIQEQTPPTPEIEPTKDMTIEKIEGGTACLGCTNDHLSTVSGALNEAIRFARTDGIVHVEVKRRLGMALDELNMLERIDLSTENIIALNGTEKQLATDILEAARDLRHKITAIRVFEDLEKVAGEASEIRTRFMSQIWDLAISDGTVQKLCNGKDGEDYQKCIETISEVLNEKRNTNEFR